MESRAKSERHRRRLILFCELTAAIIAAVSQRDFNSDGFARDYGIANTIKLI